MNSKTYIWVVFLSLLFVACSEDDNDVQEEDVATEIPSFILIGEDEENVYQYSYDAQLASGDISNLSQEDGVNLNYLSLRQASDLVTFFSFFEGSFSLIQRNVNTNSTITLENFLTVSGERSIIWGATSESQIFMAYYSPPGSGALGVRTIDTDTGLFVDTPLATDVFDTLEPMYFNNRLFAAYLDFSDKYHLVVFDSENQAVLRTFDFEDFFPSIFINEEGNLVIVKGSATSDFLLELYDLDTMDFLGQTSFTLDQFLSTGPIQAYLLDNKLYYFDILIQPSPVPQAPAVYDFSDGTNNTTDIINLMQQAQDEIGRSIFISSFGFDTNSRIFLVGYAIISENSTFDGGVIIITEDGGFIDLIELPFVPTYFLETQFF